MTEELGPPRWLVFLWLFGGVSVALVGAYLFFDPGSRTALSFDATDVFYVSDVEFLSIFVLGFGAPLVTVTLTEWLLEDYLPD